MNNQVDLEVEIPSVKEVQKAIDALYERLREAQIAFCSLWITVNMVRDHLEPCLQRKMLGGILDETKLLYQRICPSKEASNSSPRQTPKL